MIELKDWHYSLIERLIKDNDSKYEVLEIKGEHYITIDTLFEILDDTQSNREYAEEKLVELTEEFDKFKERKEENIPGLEKSLQREVNRLKEENDNLKEENEILRDKALLICDEDDLDRLAFEGVEL